MSADLIRTVQKETLSGLSVAGVRTVPMNVNVPLALSGGPVVSGSYALAEVTWHPGDTGWETLFVLGEQPADLTRTIERLRHNVANAVAVAYR